MAGYIGKSLATGGTSVDAYSKTQTDAAYLKLTGGLMTGGVRQGTKKISDGASETATTGPWASNAYTITPSMPNILLLTTASTNRTLTLPSASTVGGQVYRFTKVDSGTGMVILARAGSDTMGINANTSMELWFQDNYVDLMSDGTSRWIVMSTEMFNIPTETRGTTGNPNGADDLDSWEPANYSTGTQLVPAGTAQIQLHVILQFTGNGVWGNVTLYLRKNGSSNGPSGNTVAGQTSREVMTSGIYIGASSYPVVDCDSGRVFEWYMVNSTAWLAMYARGYRLG